MLLRLNPKRTDLQAAPTWEDIFSELSESQKVVCSAGEGIYDHQVQGVIDYMTHAMTPNLKV